MTDMMQGPVCHDPCVRGYGNPKYGVLVLGAAPGKDELRSGRPLTGPTGQLFDAILNAIGFPRENFYVTNACCWWVDGKIKAENMDKCFSRLDQEIRMVNPKLIVLMGTEVSQYWTGRTIKDARGAVLWNAKYRCYVMPIIQPAAMFHDDAATTNVQTDRISNYGQDIVRDLLKIRDILEWPQDGTKGEVASTFIRSHEEAQRVLDNLPRDTPVAVDVETNSAFVDIIDIQKDKMVSIALSDGDNTWAGLAKYFEGCVWPMDVQYTFHHAAFDTAIIHRDLGVWLPVHEDTMLKSYTCDERPGYHGLKPLAREFEGAGFYEEKRRTPEATEYTTEAMSDLLVYNAKDAAYTARLAKGKLADWQRAENTEGVYRNLLIPGINTYKEIQAHGARVNTRLLDELIQDWGNELDHERDIMREMAYEAGWPDRQLNLGSWKQLSAMLYGILALKGCQAKCCRQKETPSTNKQHLADLEGQHPFIDALIKYRHLEHNYDIYIQGWIQHIKQHKGPNHGRIHPWAKLHGTATGRRSYSDPPVQTIPRPSNQAEKYGRLRQVIIPTSDQYEIAYADYSRAEIYTGYGYSQDPAMWEDLQKDYHLETAVKAMGKSREVMLADPNYMEEMRFIAKKVTFGIMYGREAYSLALEIGCTVAQAQAYIDGWFKRNHKYAEWYANTLRILEQTGEVTTITGRKRRFVMLQPNPRALKQAVNFPIQSTAGDVTLQAVIKLHPMLKQYNTHILFDVHDAIVFEVDKRHRAEVYPLIKEVMEEQPFPDVPTFPSIPVEVYAGESWGHAKKIKDVYEIERVNAA